MSRPVKPWREYGRYGSVGIEFFMTVCFGYWGGHWLDGKIGGGRGWLTVIGSVVGVYAGFRAIFAVAKHMQTDIERMERQERGEDPWAPPSPPAANAPTSDSKKPE